MTASVISIDKKRDEYRLKALDKQHDEYLGQWLAIMLHKEGVKASTDMGKLNQLIDAVQLEMQTIEKRVYV